MKKSKMIEALFLAIDRKNSNEFLSFLTPSCVFRFGNMPDVKGKELIAQSVNSFFGSIDSLCHKVIDIWDLRDIIICHGEVTYTRQDRSELTVPFANILYLSDDLIREYLIFVDISQLY